jgi:hypothetical protein
MDAVVVTIVPPLVAIAIGIAVAHVYHMRQSSTLNKLPDKIVAKLKEDPRKKLTIPELNDLIFEKSIDWDAPHQPGNPYTPWKACPRCGNTDLTYGEVDGPRDHTYYITGCKKCNWFESGE